MPAAQILWDDRIRGLCIRVGANRATWMFYAEQREHGKRSTIAKRIGFWPSMSVVQARAAARKIAGQLADDRLEPGRRAALRVKDAIDNYIAHLAATGKSKTWSRIARGIADNNVLPTWGHFPLADVTNAGACRRLAPKNIQAARSCRRQ